MLPINSFSYLEVMTAWDISGFSLTQARLAQSVEHQTFNLRVAGSSPSSGDGNFEEPKITKMKKKTRLGPSFKKLPKLTVFDVF